MSWYNPFSWLKKKESKQQLIINESDVDELKEIERKNYMQEARVLMEKRGKERAKKDLVIKGDDGWQTI